MSKWNRERTISAVYIGPAHMENMLVDRVYDEVARGIVQKLREFRKYKVRDMPHGEIMVECDLTIIVPYPSNRAIPPGPSPE